MIFDMKLYKPSDLEKWICQKYQDNGIMTPADMDLDQVGQVFKANIVYKSVGDARVIYDDVVGSLIFLNIHDPIEQQRLKFFHELCHPAMHVGSQEDLPSLFVELQEAQAATFQLYSAMPAYMIVEIEPEYTWHEYNQKLADTFRLPLQFVHQRIDQVRRRINQAHYDRNMQARLNGAPARYGYTVETLRILNQLHSQISKQREALN